MRNRSEGWKFAKEGGHELEEKLKQRINANVKFSSELHNLIFGKTYPGKAEAFGGGKGAKKVPSVLGHLTPSKADLIVKWDSDSSARISIKKSLGGQVWLISLKHFLGALNEHYGVFPGKKVVECLGKFIGSPEFQQDIDFKKLKLKGPRHRDGKLLEIHQGRLCAATIIENFPDMWEQTIKWFNENIDLVTELCFSKGLCKYPADQADHLWYFDLNQEESRGVNQLLSIKTLLIKIRSLKDSCIAGAKNGGTTIQTPFGFLQMHSPAKINELQFHHNYSKISSLSDAHQG